MTETPNGLLTEDPFHPWLPQDLDRVFHPNAVAIVGASGDASNPGYRYLRQLRQFGFPGPIYAVNPGLKEVLGQPCYPSLRQVPGDVDYVISCVPARVVLQIIDDCAAKGTKLLHLYSARFSETGLPEPTQLEADLVRTARGAGLRILGPNCMGLYAPDAGMTFRFGFPEEAGHVGVISQSGGNSARLVLAGAGRGLRFSKIISYGNGADINEAELLEYLAWDEETKAIGLYVEGIKNGRAFLAALQQAARAKPVVVLKGGRSAAGSRAAASHTASLAGDDLLWDAVCRQAGAARVDTIDELADTLLAFQYLPPCTGTRVAVLGGGGGDSVAAADACERAGLTVPRLPQEIVERMQQAAPQVWSLVGNPLDASATGGTQNFSLAAELLAKHPAIDMIICNANADWILDQPDDARNFAAGALRSLGIATSASKPTVLVLGSLVSYEHWRWEATQAVLQPCLRASVPVYPSLERASLALARYAAYYRKRLS